MLPVGTSRNFENHVARGDGLFRLYDNTDACQLTTGLTVVLTTLWTVGLTVDSLACENIFSAGMSPEIGPENGAENGAENATEIGADTNGVMIECAASEPLAIIARARADRVKPARPDNRSYIAVASLSLAFISVPACAAAMSYVIDDPDSRAGRLGIIPGIIICNDNVDSPDMRLMILS